MSTFNQSVQSNIEADDHTEALAWVAKTKSQSWWNSNDQIIVVETPDPHRAVFVDSPQMAAAKTILKTYDKTKFKASDTADLIDALIIGLGLK